MIYFVDHFDSFSFNVKAWLEAGRDRQEVIRIPADDLIGLKKILNARRPVVLSPGPKSPADYPATMVLCRELAGQVPVLGICLGHQMLGTAFGWEVTRSAVPFHGSRRVIKVMASASRLLDPGSFFEAATYNSLVLGDRQPAPRAGAVCFKVTAICEAGEVQAIESVSGALAAGVQFHPESFLSEFKANAELRDRWLASVRAWETGSV